MTGWDVTQGRVELERGLGTTDCRCAKTMHASAAVRNGAIISCGGTDLLMQARRSQVGFFARN